MEQCDAKGEDCDRREYCARGSAIHASGEYCVRGSADVRGEVHVLTRAAVNIGRSWRVESY